MFNQNTTADTKIAVLEERMSSYEIMLRKIDEAIQLMGKTNQNISKMLAVHNEKIEQCGKADDLIITMIEDMKVENKEQHDSVSERIEKVEVKIEEFAKFRWVLVGVVSVITFVVSQAAVVSNFLSPSQSSIQIEKSK